MHGMWGNPAHLAEASRFIREKADSRTKQETDGEYIELEVLVAHANQNGSTYDGIDWGGERIADEVSAIRPVLESPLSRDQIMEHIEKLEKDSKKKVTKFSVLGYSLGGLLGRYVIG
jgi:hypothetical protein